MQDKCHGCVWATPTMYDDNGVPIQVYCLPHEGGCPHTQEERNDGLEK